MPLSGTGLPAGVEGSPGSGKGSARPPGLLHNGCQVLGPTPCRSAVGRELDSDRDIRAGSAVDGDGRARGGAGRGPRQRRGLGNRDTEQSRRQQADGNCAETGDRHGASDAGCVSQLLLVSRWARPGQDRTGASSLPWPWACGSEAPASRSASLDPADRDHDPVRISLRDAAYLMTTVSDNAAAGLLLRRVGGV
ncbi:serine hydrolase [Streptomyces sp. NPDC058874]|uniref:serine hydrolase n=1 Tax=unclassified Streptomyces TaxID=2593676 RepID=UPI00368A503A